MTYGKIMLLAVACIVLVMVLSGCSRSITTEPVLVTKEVKVPVATTVQPPAELFRKEVTASQLPEWMLPGDPRAVVATDAAGAEKLKSLISSDHGLQDGWEQWIK